MRVRVQVLLGMHLCGDLSRRAIEIFDNRADIGAALVAPCCLQRQIPLRLRPPGSWGYDTTELARKSVPRRVPYELWTERLLEASGALDRNKRIWRDEAMMSEKNTFILMHRGMGMLVAEAAAC